MISLANNQEAVSKVAASTSPGGRVNVTLASYMELTSSEKEWHAFQRLQTTDAQSVECHVERIKWEPGDPKGKTPGSYAFFLVVPAAKLLNKVDAPHALVPLGVGHYQEYGDKGENGYVYRGENPNVSGVCTLLGGPRGPVYLTAWTNPDRDDKTKKVVQVILSRKLGVPEKYRDRPAPAAPTTLASNPDAQDDPGQGSDEIPF
jgi:hypothetical protein